MADQKHTYAYRAINDEGVTLTGDIEAESAEQARQALLGRGLMPTEVTRRDGPLKSKRFQKFFQKPVTYKQIILFSKQFRTLFNAGVSITQLLGILQTQTENPTLKAATADIAQQVSTGGTLYNAFRSHPDIFSPLYCSMIRAGEFSGSMGDVLDRLTYLLEHENKIRNDVKSALRYPKIVLITLAGAFFFLLNWVVPSFAKLFVNAKIELPWPTRMALAMNTALSDYWYLLLAAAVGMFFGVRWWIRTSRGRYLWARTLLTLPLVGKVVQMSIMARFAAIFSILQRSGVSILDSLDILSETINNAALEREFSTIKEKLRSGQGIAEPLSTARYFTPLTINMVAVGEGAAAKGERQRDGHQQSDRLFHSPDLQQVSISASLGMRKAKNGPVQTYRDESLVLPHCFASALRHMPHRASHPSRKKSAPVHGLKSPGDVTVAPVVPTAVSTHRSRNELRWDAPGPRTDRPLSEEALAVTLSAQTHLPMVSRLVQGTLIIHLSEKDCKFNIRIL